MRFVILWLLIVVMVSGCATYRQPEQTPEEYRSRLTTSSESGLTVSAVVLSAEEELQEFAAKLSKNEIQPIWFEITNTNEHKYILMLPSVDRDYFSATEAAWQTRGWWERGTQQKTSYFLERHIPVVIGPGSTISGFIFTNIDPGIKVLTVELISEQDDHRFEFVLAVPGFEADFVQSNPAERYAGDNVPDLDRDQLRTYLEKLPCCALGGDRVTPGDPLNLVVIGDGPDILAAFARQGWDLTEPAKFATAWRTFWSSIFSSRYRTSPVSALYLFDRPQDAALQKSRKSVDERNHLRLWRAPVNHQGQPIWIGQISRDIGVKFSSKTIVTHKIDSVVDEARLYIMMDLLTSHYVNSYGLVKGVGMSTLSQPRYNYTNDPYVTDGLRAVMMLSSDPVDYIDIDWLGWEGLRRPTDTWADTPINKPIGDTSTSPEREAP